MQDQPRFADAEKTTPIHLVDESELNIWTAIIGTTSRWIRTNGFTASLGEILVVPDADGRMERVLIGWGNDESRSRGRFHLTSPMAKLPPGNYRIQNRLEPEDAQEVALAALLAQYRYRKFRKRRSPTAKIIPPRGVDPKPVETIASAEFLIRDIINAPASDLGPDALDDMFTNLAAVFGANLATIRDPEHVQTEFPLLHAVGKASAEPPRMLDLTWGDADRPQVTVIGKGICFDTGGLNIKPGNSMRLMKKDLGGAAVAMGLARMVMAEELPVRLRLIVPVAENAISGNAMRPGDIYWSRKGKSVEIGNTDAEGRLVLADALTLADDESPDLMICFATLTGAARVALGADIAPFFTTCDRLASELMAAAKRVRDPLWRMPFWAPYEGMIESGTADLTNSPASSFAGSITAALFLRRFVSHTPAFAHFDLYGWQSDHGPGRPAGGLGQGARAVFEALPKILSF